MASAVPKPVSAALGLVPSVLGGVRRLPGKAVQLPVIAVSLSLAGLDRAKRQYGDLSDRGERLVARLRGTSFDELEDRVEAKLNGTRVASLYDRAEDALEDVVDKAREVTQAVKGDPRTAAAKAGEAAKDAAQQVRESTEARQAVEAVQDPLDAMPEAERPKGEPTPKAAQPDSTRLDTAATPDVVRAVEQAALAAQVPSAEELALPDYDHMTLGSLRGRLRSLSVEQLVTLRAYEKAHADRLPVITMLDNRIAKLAAGDAKPTGSTPAESSPKASTARKPPKKVGETAEAKNDAPPHTKVRTT